MPTPAPVIYLHSLRLLRAQCSPYRHCSFLSTRMSVCVCGLCSTKSPPASCRAMPETHLNIASCSGFLFPRLLATRRSITRSLTGRASLGSGSRLCWVLVPVAIAPPAPSMAPRFVRIDTMRGRVERAEGGRQGRDSLGWGAARSQVRSRPASVRPCYGSHCRDDAVTQS